MRQAFVCQNVGTIWGGRFISTQTVKKWVEHWYLPNLWKAQLWFLVKRAKNVYPLRVSCLQQSQQMRNNPQAPMEGKSWPWQHLNSVPIHTLPKLTVGSSCLRDFPQNSDWWYHLAFPGIQHHSMTWSRCSLKELSPYLQTLRWPGFYVSVCVLFPWQAKGNLSFLRQWSVYSKELSRLP